MDSKFERKVAEFYIRKSRSAKDRGIEFRLNLTSVRNLLSAKKCYYTGIPLTTYDGVRQRPTDITIDRVDASKGYEKGNVVACCNAANTYKSLFENGGDLNLSHLKKMSKKLSSM
tara:strand:- start:52 stop:396 length:345 start_codon:yes stop_codon:yes gene_type:complete